MNIKINPTDLIRYDTIIRITQYIPLSTNGDDTTSNASLIDGWQQTCASYSGGGVLYRELCRQVPEWSALVKKEIDKPIEAAFIEYLVAEPDTDLNQVAALPPGHEERYLVVQVFIPSPSVSRRNLSTPNREP